MRAGSPQDATKGAVQNLRIPSRNISKETQSECHGSLLGKQRRESKGSGSVSESRLLVEFVLESSKCAPTGSSSIHRSPHGQWLGAACTSPKTFASEPFAKMATSPHNNMVMRKTKYAHAHMKFLRIGACHVLKNVEQQTLRKLRTHNSCV